MAKALILFATRTGETEKIGNIIAEGLRISGVETDIRNVNAVKKEDELAGYDALILGSATYHGEMMQPMKTFLFLAEKADLKGKAGGAFGAFGWSGEAPDRIFDTMQNIFGMKLTNTALRLKSSTLQGGIQAAQNYGKEVAGLLG